MNSGLRNPVPPDVQVAAPALPIGSFHPPARTLMGPGPSDVHPRVTAAMGARTVGHLDPAFVHLMDEIKQLLQYSFVTRNRLTIPVSAPGSAGMECVFVNLLEPGDKAIVCQNGVFGGRMKENVERCGAKAVLVQDDWGKPVDPAKVEAALKANPDAKLLAFVHAETSTGVLSDVPALAALAHQYGCLVVVDTVTGLGGVPLFVDAWGVDAVYSGSQIGAGLGALAGKVWRIGLMGESACKRNVLLCLGALDAVLMDLKAPIHGGAAVAAALAHYARG